MEKKGGSGGGIQPDLGDFGLLFTVVFVSPALDHHNPTKAAAVELVQSLSLLTGLPVCLCFDLTQ